MSTKFTIAHNRKEGNDFHLYFDFADSLYHLDFYGENASKTIIPEETMKDIVEAFKKRNFTLPGNVDFLESLAEEEDNNKGII